MTAVVKAILLDGEARNVSLALRVHGGGQAARTPPAHHRTGADVPRHRQHRHLQPIRQRSAITINTAKPHHFSAGDVRVAGFQREHRRTPRPAITRSTGSYYRPRAVPPTANSRLTVSALELSPASPIRPGGQLEHPDRQHQRTSGGRRGLPEIRHDHRRHGDGRHLHGDQRADHQHSFTVTTTGAAPTTAIERHGDPAEIHRGTITITNPTGSTASTITIATYTNANVERWRPRLWLHLARGQAVDRFRVDGRQRDRRAALHRDDCPRSTTPKPASAPSRRYPLTRAAAHALGQRRAAGQQVRHGQHQRADRAVAVSIHRRCSISSTPITSIPACLAASGVTTPEFQLTTDSNIMTLTNTVNSTRCFQFGQH